MRRGKSIAFLGVPYAAPPVGIRTGDPYGRGLQRWPRLKSSGPMIPEFGLPARRRPLLQAGKLRAFTHFIESGGEPRLFASGS